jgi:hypothetical protein
MIEESIQYAKQAVELDVKDGASWCKLDLQIKVIYYLLFFKIHWRILMFAFILWLKIIQKI